MIPTLVAVIAAPATLAGRARGNLVLVGSHAPIDARGLETRTASRDGRPVEVLAAVGDVDRFVAGATVLTDDFAPVDQMLLP